MCILNTKLCCSVRKKQKNVSCRENSKQGMSRFYIFFAFVILLCCHACQPSGNNTQFTIAFSQCIGDDAWRETMLDEMKRELSFYPDIEFIYRDAGGDNQKQIQQIKEILEQDIDLLIVSPNEAEPLTPIVDSVFQKNIPVIVTDRKTSSGLYNAYVGADNLAIGKLAGQFIVHTLNGRGQVGIVTGLKGTSASIERKKGFLDALDSAGAVRLGIEIQSDWERHTAYTQAKQHIKQLLEQDIILAFNDQMAFGVIQALREAGENHKRVIGIDALPGEGNGLSEIVNGTLFASMLYPTGGTEAIRTAMAILQRKPYKRDNILGTVVINQDNAGLMMLQSNKIQEQQEDIDKRQELIVEQNKIYRNQQTTLNVLITSLVLAVVFGGISIIVIKSNWEKNKHLEKQNEEILSQQQQIVEMNEQIRTASEAQSKFFTNVSHEFKTPLTLILAPMEELEKEKNLSSEGADQLARIKRNAKKLQNLVTDLIDIHRIDKAKRKLQAAPVQIDAFVQQVLASFKSLSQKKRISLSYISKTPLKEIWIDEYLMEQALSNLLSNAFKFTAKGGKINVVVEENTFGDHLYIRVVDNGSGISVTDMDYIFDNFYQGEQHLSGSGIGLAYVKEIVELHHGQVTVSSKKGVGSSFTLRLPTGHLHLSEDEKKGLLDHTSTRQTEREEHILNVEELTEETVSFYSSKAANILVVDDHPDIRLFLKDILKKEYNLLFAKSYLDAIAKMEQSYPDLVVSDIMLPDGSGLDLLKMIKNSPQFNKTPVLLLSALDTEEDKIEGMRLMADAYLTKPFSVDHLKAVITNLLTSRRQLKDHYTSILEPGETATDIKQHTARDKRFMQSLDMVIEEHIGKKSLSVEDIAHALNISRVQLYRKTKNLLNSSVNEYLLQRRLTKSKHLLLEGLNINEVAEKVGFSSAAYFAAAFKKQFGITPTAFRKDKLK